MNNKHEKDEHLEKLWYMKEEQKQTLDDLKASLGKEFNPDVLDDLSSQKLIKLDKRKGDVSLSATGEDHARQLIRAHRLAERMLHDVMGGDFETGACEFEHIVTPELVDGICTLLGHPKECPHGMPIPEGNCCKTSAKTLQSSVIPVSDLKIGQSARVAYVHCKSDQQLHKIDGLQIRPGAIVKLHQNYPTFVIECEGANIAMDENVAANIRIWKEQQHVLKDS